MRVHPSPLNDPRNLVDVAQHSGSHSEQYHMYVYLSLLAAIDSSPSSPATRGAALEAELDALSKDLLGNPSILNGW